MSLHLVSDSTNTWAASDRNGLAASPLASPPPVHSVPPFAQPSGAASIAILSFAVIAQAIIGLLVVDSPDRHGLQTLLASSGALAMCGSALILYRYQAAAKARTQAGHVYISTHRLREEDGSLKVLARVYNNSDAPIWHVEVKPRRDGAPYNSELVQHLPDILPSTVEEWEWCVGKEGAPHEERYPELIFLDAHERRWRRIGARLEGPPRRLLRQRR